MENYKEFINSRNLAYCMGFGLYLRPTKESAVDFASFSSRILKSLVKKDFQNKLEIDKIINFSYFTKDKTEIEILPEKIEISSYDTPLKEVTEKIKRLLFLIVNEVNFETNFKLRMRLSAAIETQEEIYPELKEIKKFNGLSPEFIGFKSDTISLTIYPHKHIHFGYKTKIEFKNIKELRYFEAFFEQLKIMGINNAD